MSEAQAAYIRSIEHRIEAAKQEKQDRAAFLLWLVMECRSTLPRKED